MFALIGLSSALVLSCSKAGEAPPERTASQEGQERQKISEAQKEGEAREKTVSENGTVTETEDLSPVEAPGDKEALVIYTSGRVIYRTSVSSEWKPVEIGQRLSENETLKVGETAYCELQFGESAVVKVKKSTTLSLARVDLKQGKRNVKMKMDVGTVLNKVNNLAKGEEFKVQTPSAVSGVRGTQFMVEVGIDKTTTVAVKEGTVAVQPGSQDTEEVKKKVGGSSETLLKALELIEQTSTLVSANQQIDIDEAAAQKNDQALEKVTESAEKISEEDESAPSEEEIEKIVKQTGELVREAAERKVAPKELNEEKSRELQEIDEMKLITITPPQEKAPAGDAEEAEEEQIGEEKEKAPKINVYKVAVHVEPEGAQIVLNGKERGRGSFSGLFEQGEQLSFKFSRKGFESHSFEITVSEATAKRYRIQLAEKAQEEPVTESFTIEAEPKSARILVDGEEVAAGSYSASYEVGREITFTVEKESYKQRKIPVTVSKGSGKTIDVELEQKSVPVAISAEPVDSEIFLNGEQVGTGSFSGQFETGRELSFTVRREGYRPEPLEFTVSGEVQSRNVSLQRRTQQVVVSPEPEDAQVSINGDQVGRGRISRDIHIGRDLNITARREGYRSMEVSYTTKDSGEKRFSLDLEPLPLQFTTDVSSSQLIGDAVSYENLVLSADADGRLFAVTRDGEKRWELATKNKRNENSYPVVIGSTVYFTGANEMVKVDARSGSVISRSPLSGDAVHLFGRRVVGYGKSVLMPTNSEIRVLDPSSGEVRRRISVPGESRMTPALWNGSIITVNQQGTLLAIDPKEGEVQKEIPTGGMQPVALTPSIRGDTAVFSGRKGTVVCADLAEGEVQWESSLSGGSGSVFSNPECSDTGVYLFAGSSIHGLSMQDGSGLFDPITGATSPPLYRGGTLYYGTKDGGLVAADARTGEVKDKIESEKIITTRPAESGERIVAGTKDGSVLVMHP